MTKYSNAVEEFIRAGVGHTQSATGRSAAARTAPSPNHWSTDVLRWALQYVSIGFALVPIWGVGDSACLCGNHSCRSPGKHPMATLVPNGVKNATTSEVLVRAWFEAHPEANLAVATGRPSGIGVADIDPRNGGSLELARDQFHLPLDTLTVMTGGGGWHLYYRLQAGQALRTWHMHAGIDIKGDGGYVLLPPSLHVSGKRYAI